MAKGTSKTPGTTINPAQPIDPNKAKPGAAAPKGGKSK